LKEEETESRGGAASLLFWPSGGSQVFWKRWVRRFRVFFFVFFLMFQNCPPSFSMFWKLLFIGKNIARSPNLIPQLLSFFCKFDFFLFLFLDFSYQHRLEMKKIGDFK
jgi:hypothetical protein